MWARNEQNPFTNIAPKRDDCQKDYGLVRNRRRTSFTPKLKTDMRRVQSHQCLSHGHDSFSSLSTTRSLKSNISNRDFERFRSTVSQMKITTNFALKQFILEHGNDNPEDSLSDDDSFTSDSNDDDDEVSIEWPSRPTKDLRNEKPSESKEETARPIVRNRSNQSFIGQSSSGAKDFKKAYRRLSMQSTCSLNSTFSGYSNTKEKFFEGFVNIMNNSVNTLSQEL